MSGFPQRNVGGWPVEIPGMGPAKATRCTVKCERCHDNLTSVRYGALALCKGCAIGEASVAGSSRPVE